MPNRPINGCSFAIGALFVTSFATPVFAANDDVPEAIDVTGDRGDINLQLQVDRAEDAFYEIFNNLIEDEDFRIECRYEKELGSLIKKRICQTGYMRKELSTAASLNYIGINYMASSALAEKNRQLRKMTTELLESSPELRRAALNLNARVEEYRDEYGIKDD